ncbi:hypothetical protein U9M48_043715 [Paspalum notatum var. saurae]|uniref:Uncharacterized protein n=1 Tax=Paspalum notatum var. saurae TaxID=547442 RepID=A0AAQ3UTI6_PASNO
MELRGKLSDFHQWLWSFEDRIATKWLWFEKELSRARSAAAAATAAAEDAYRERDDAWGVLGDDLAAAQARVTELTQSRDAARELAQKASAELAAAREAVQAAWEDAHRCALFSVLKEREELEQRHQELDGKAAKLEALRSEHQSIEAKLLQYNEQAKRREAALRKKEEKQLERENAHVQRVKAHRTDGEALKSE